MAHTWNCCSQQISLVELFFSFAMQQLLCDFYDLQSKSGWYQNEKKKWTWDKSEKHDPTSDISIYVQILISLPTTIGNK